MCLDRLDPWVMVKYFFIDPISNVYSGYESARDVVRGYASLESLGKVFPTDLDWFVDRSREVASVRKLEWIIEKGVKNPFYSAGTILFTVVEALTDLGSLEVVDRVRKGRNGSFLVPKSHSK